MRAKYFSDLISSIWYNPQALFSTIYSPSDLIINPSHLKPEARSWEMFGTWQVTASSQLSAALQTMAPSPQECRARANQENVKHSSAEGNYIFDFPTAVLVL